MSKRANLFLLLLSAAMGSCNPLGSRSTVEGNVDTLVIADLTSSTTDPTGTSPIPITATWSVPVGGFSLVDIEVINGTAQNLSGGATVYEFEIVPAAGGLVTVTIPAGAAQDENGITSDPSTFTRTFDAALPTVTLEQAAGQADPTPNLPIQFTVTFSEPMDPTSFTTSDIVQTGTASGITWSITDSGDHTVYTLSATAITGNAGTVIPSLAVGAAVDEAGNDSAASTSSDHSVFYIPSYSSLYLWLRADSLSLANGANVTTWPDQSSFTNPVSEAINTPTFLTNAVNSLPAVTFNGSDLLRSAGNSGISGNPDLSIFIVARVNAAGNWPTLLQIGEGTTNGSSIWFGLWGTSTQIYTAFFGGGVASTASASTAFALYEWRRNSGTGTNPAQTGNTQYWNSVAVATTNILANNAINVTNGVFRIGRSILNATISADIAEILVFPILLTPAERVQIEGYLNAKYGLY